MKVPIDPAYRLGIGFPDTDAREAIDRLLAIGAGTVILFARNLVDARQARALIAEIRAAVPWPLLFCIDQEGGNVVRFTREVTLFPGNMALGAADDEALAHAQGVQMGRELRALGFDLNLMPVLDLARTPDNPGIGQRSFGADPARAAALGRALARGVREGGVACTLKHFPGKGAARTDAHLDLPVIETSAAEHRAMDLIPFQALIEDGVEAVMTSHVVYRGFGEDRPVTFSRRLVHEWLRDELGFRGLITTDDLQMGAIEKHYGFDHAILEAAQAGHDVLFVCHDRPLQERAAKLLRDAVASGQLNSDENRAACARIAAATGTARGELTPHMQRAGEALAREIAERSIAVLEDPYQVLPWPRGGSVLVLFPRLRALVAVEEEVGHDAAAMLEPWLKERFDSFDVELYDLDPAPEVAEAMLQRAAQSSRVLVFTYNAAYQPAQARMMCDERLIGARSVFIHLRNPFDQALIAHRAAGIAAWGYRRSQLRAALAALCGEIEFRGRSPVDVFAASRQTQS